ncbi:MAG: hypothetical protein L3J76_01865 [Candidatus Hydrothermae bacterium]|nr:hypothetical protein [Candidatus Hydrothermae bacterium]
MHIHWILAYAALALNMPGGRTLPVEVHPPKTAVQRILLCLATPPEGLWATLPEGTLGYVLPLDTLQDYDWLVPWPDPQGGGQTRTFWDKTLQPFLDSLRTRYPGVPVILYGEGLTGLTVLYLGWMAPESMQMVIALRPALTAGQGMIFSLVKEAPEPGPSRIVLGRTHDRYNLVLRLSHLLQLRGYALKKTLWVLEPGESWTPFLP